MAGSESWLSWVFKIVNFVVLVGLLVKFGGKPLKEYLANRHKTVKEKVEEADRRFKEAEALKAQYESRLAGLDEEISSFKKAVMEETEREKKKMLDDAEAFSLRIREQAKATYEQEMRDIRGKIKEEIARLTVEKAEQLVREKLGRTDHDKLVDEFIEKLRSLN
jgi:F-type H+-transporting ATPase subunit b